MADENSQLENTAPNSDAGGTAGNGAAGTGAAPAQSQVVSVDAALATLPVDGGKDSGAKSEAEKPSRGISGAVLDAVDGIKGAIQKRRGRKPGPHPADCPCSVCRKAKSGSRALLGTPPADTATETKTVSAPEDKPLQVVPEIDISQYEGWGDAAVAIRRGYYDFSEFPPLRELAVRKYGKDAQAICDKYLFVPTANDAKIHKLGARLAADCGLPAAKSDYLNGAVALLLDHQAISAQLQAMRRELAALPDYQAQQNSNATE